MSPSFSSSITEELIRGLNSITVDSFLRNLIIKYLLAVFINKSIESNIKE